MYIYSYKNNYTYTGNNILDKIINYYFNKDTKYIVSYKSSQKFFKSYKPHRNILL